MIFMREKASVMSLDGKKMHDIELPKAFRANVDSALIKRAVLSMQSTRIQPKSNCPYAGIDNTATYIGARRKPQMHHTINVGHARLPRLKNRRFILQGDVAQVPQARGGARAHPPKVEQVREEKINRKERRKAIEAAIAATADRALVEGHGHKLGEKVELPLVVEDKFESLEKTKDVLNALKALHVSVDVEKAKGARKIRAGKGKMRGRKYKKAKSLLVVVKNTEKIFRAARNLEGVDVVEARNLNAELLAPGAVPGRLVLWSESALKSLRVN